jgi:hypothetical protein
VIIVAGLFQQTVKSLALRTLSDVTLTERGDGRGTITFGPTLPSLAMWQSGSWPGMEAYAACLEDIDDARGVYRTILQLREGKAV